MYLRSKSPRWLNHREILHIPNKEWRMQEDSCENDACKKNIVKSTVCVLHVSLMIRKTKEILQYFSTQDQVEVIF